MAPTDENLWRILQKGDRVRIVHFPYEHTGRKYTMHEETRAAYRHLIETEQELIVSRIDDDGFPWVEFATKTEDRGTEYHDLMINHDGLVLIE